MAQRLPHKHREWDWRGDARSHIRRKRVFLFNPNLLTPNRVRWIHNVRVITRSLIRSFEFTEIKKRPYNSGIRTLQLLSKRLLREDRVGPGHSLRHNHAHWLPIACETPQCWRLLLRAGAESCWPLAHDTFNFPLLDIRTYFFTGWRTICSQTAGSVPRIAHRSGIHPGSASVAHIRRLPLIHGGFQLALQGLPLVNIHIAADYL